MQFRGVNIQPQWERLAERQVETLRELVAITSVQIGVERQRGARPPFRVRVRLGVAGPEYHAQATDQTFQAALLKAIYELRTQILWRKIKRQERQKSNLQLGGLLLRRSSGAIGHRL